MPTAKSVEWTVCRKCKDEAGIGVALPDSQLCWAHVNGSDLKAALQRLTQTGRLDLRGVSVAPTLFRDLLDAAPHNDNDSPVLTQALFKLATFEGDVGFQITFQCRPIFIETTFKGATGFWSDFTEGADFSSAEFQDNFTLHGQFESDAIFSNTRFEGEAAFRVRFKDQASFGGAKFQDVRFSNSIFENLAGFHEATFQRQADFRGVTFGDTAWFSQSTFEEDVTFEGATFLGKAYFPAVRFVHWADFGRATFQGQVLFGLAIFGEAISLDEATFHRRVSFDGSTFERARRLGPMVVRTQLLLDAAVFKERIQIEIAAAVVCARAVRFAGGALLRVRWAQIVLEDADLATPVILASATGSFPQEEKFERQWTDRRLPESQQPRLLSLRRADIAGLTVSGIDLRACRFAGAHNLDKLRIEGTPKLAPPPPGWHLRRVGGEGLPIWRWTARMTLAEEQQWRATRRLRSTPSGRRHPQLRGWYPPACRPTPVLAENDVRSPVELAALYRELRKGREDAKDEPGAADFYYGEMEMRRHDPSKHWGERAILWAYWLVSGYALRASRALVALLAVILLSALLFASIGFIPPDPVASRLIDVRNGGLRYELTCVRVRRRTRNACNVRRAGSYLRHGSRTPSRSALSRPPPCCGPHNARLPQWESGHRLSCGC
jgi:uncharacterized protein YjbI with pentapeptide repeats